MRTMLMVAAVAVVGWIMVVAPAQAADPPIFFTMCTESHRLSDDPIVAPGRPGAAHSHDFTGAWSTDAHSTVESLRRSGTTCDLSGDTAGYWTPTLYKDATPVRSTTFAYYVNGQKDRTTIKAHPAGLKVVADMSAGYGSGWHCGDGKPPAQGGTLSQTTIPDCPDDNIKSLQAKIVFPDCWDGRNLDSPDHRSHMAYASQTGKCPASHPVPVPRLNLKTRYVNDEGDALNVDPARLSISSGAPGGMHADFFNAWDQAELERLVKRCINNLDRAGEPCRGKDQTTDNPNHPNPTPPDRAPASPLPPAPPDPDEPNDPSPTAYDDVVKADSPVWYAPQEFNFDGTNEKMLHDLSGPLGDFTMETWMAPEDFSSMRYAFAATAEGKDKLGLYTISAGIRALAVIEGETVELTWRDPTPGTRRHVALTRRGSTLGLWVDGVQRQTANGPSGQIDPFACALGAHPGGYANFKGDTDHPALYADALSAQRIAAHHQADKG